MFITPWHIYCCSVVSFIDHDFFALDMFDDVVFFELGRHFLLLNEQLIWERCCGVGKIKSMSETSGDFPHLEFPRFHQTVLCWAASLEYSSQGLAG